MTFADSRVPKLLPSCTYGGGVLPILNWKKNRFLGPWWGEPVAAKLAKTTVDNKTVENTTDIDAHTTSTSHLVVCRLV